MFQQEEISRGKVQIHLLHFKDFQWNTLSSSLLPEEEKRVIEFKSTKRKKEYVATRHLRTLLFGLQPIIYSEVGVPSIRNEKHISISHTKNIVGIAQCKDFCVGLDIEPVRKKILRLQEKFLADSEKEMLNTSSVNEMTKVWSGKEALYKLAGRKRIIFKENLLLHKIEEEKWKGQICFPNDFREVELQLFSKKDYIISINTSPCS